MSNFEFSKEAINEGIKLVKEGSTKSKVEAFGMFVHDMSTNEAKEFANKVFEKCGLSPNAYGRADHEETVKYLRANYGKLPKKELIEGMCKINGKTYKTNQHAYNYVSMMIEWAKQELAEKENS